MTTLELIMFYPEALNLASTWLVSGLIKTEAELIELTLKYQEELTANHENRNNHKETQDARVAHQIGAGRGARL